MPAAKKQNIIQKPIPVTLLSGFLGSGKTTLLERILTTNHGFKVAVIINDISQLNIDAELIKNHKVTKKEEKLIQLQNGCICCTLRGDLLEELCNLATSGDFQYIVIESTGISEPMQVAETFTTEFSETLLQSEGTMGPEEQKTLEDIVKLGGLHKLTQLDTCVTVIDAMNFLSNFETTEFLADRYGDNGQGEKERTITDLMVNQIEFADVIIINKISTIKRWKLRKINKIIKSLNPVAKVLNADYCNVPINEVINTKLFDFEKVTASAGWLQSINEMTIREGYGNKNMPTMTPKPETEEYGISNFIYKARKPFHPERLYRLIRDRFVVIEQAGLEDEEETQSKVKQYNGENSDSDLDLDDSEDEQEADEQEAEEQDGADETNGDKEMDVDDAEVPEITEKQIINNKKKSVFGTTLRSKGFVWLASRYIGRGEWSSAGTMLTLKGGIPWFAVTGSEDIPEEARALIEQDMEGKYGDRRNELVFIGTNLNKKGITEALNACLLNDEEYELFESLTSSEEDLIRTELKLQKSFIDGFMEWITIEGLDGAEDEEEEAESEETDDEMPERGNAHLDEDNKEEAGNNLNKSLKRKLDQISHHSHSHHNHSHGSPTVKLKVAA